MDAYRFASIPVARIVPSQRVGMPNAWATGDKARGRHSLLGPRFRSFPVDSACI